MVLVLEAAKSSERDVPPDIVISGSNTGLNNQSAVGVDSQGYYYATVIVGDKSSEILVFDKSASGNVAPIRNISGLRTHMKSPFYPTVF